LHGCNRSRRKGRTLLRGRPGPHRLALTVIRVSAIFQAEGDVIETAILLLFILVYTARDTEVIDDLVVMTAW
jgi:hypothetical protein